MKESKPISAEEVLENIQWVNRLARALVRESSDATDVAQDAWEVALTDRTRRGSLGAWLTGVVRNRARMRSRSESRRSHYEAAAADDTAEPPTPEMIAERLEAQELVARLVQELEPKVRQVLYLRFYEDLSSAEISRRLGVPAGTVRWRLKTGLDALRTELDQSLGSRSRWALLLMPTLDTTAATIKGAFAMKKIVVALAVLLALLATVLVVIRGRSGGSHLENAARNSDAGLTQTTVVERERARAQPELPIPLSFVEPGGKAQRVAGVVVYKGEPVADARVVATSVLSQAGLREPYGQSTDTNGRFDFGLLPQTMVTITASAANRAPVQIKIDLTDLSRRPASDELLLELQDCNHGLYGVVMDNSGGPIVGAELRIGGIANVGTGTTSDAKGQYQICFGALRYYSASPAIGVHADGYGDLNVVRDVVGRVRVDIVMVPAGVLRGRVVGVDSGQGIPEAYVWLRAEGHLPIRAAERVAVTGEGGEFSIGDLPPGRYQIGARIPGYLQVGKAVTTTVAAGLETPEVQIALEPAARIEGVVINEGEPLAGSYVSVVRNDTDEQSVPVRSKADGRFVISAAPYGAVTFKVMGYDVVSPKQLQVRERASSEVTVSVTGLGTIRGIVKSGGAPISGAEVTARGGLPPFSKAESMSDGSFEIRGLRPGEYQVFAVSHRTMAFTREPRDTVAVELALGETRDIVIDLGGGASIQGLVEDTDGQPLEGLYVEYVDRTADDLCRSWTDREGRFLCTMLAGGTTYYPSVRPGQGSQTKLPTATGDDFPGVLVPDGSSELLGQRLVVRNTASSIRGVVRLTNGQPAADAIVRSVESGSNRTPVNSPWFTFPYSVADVDGAFSLSVFEGGTYDLYARSPVGGGEAKQVGIVAGQSDIVLRVEAPSSIAGEIVGFTLPPSVQAQRLGDSKVHPITATNGSFALHGLASGTYWVWAFSGRESSAQQVTLKPGATARVVLASRGTARIEGQVVDFITGDPVANAACFVWPYLGGQPVYRKDAPSAQTDSSGHFSLEGTAGDVQVHCQGSMFQSDGVVRLNAAKGQTAQAIVPIVVVRHLRPPNSVGLDFSWWELSRAVTAIRSNSPAASAGVQPGDVVITVGGRSVEALTGRGVRALIGDHELGETVEIGLRRGTAQRMVSLPVEGPLW